MMHNHGYTGYQLYFNDYFCEINIYTKKENILRFSSGFYGGSCRRGTMKIK